MIEIAKREITRNPNMTDFQKIRRPWFEDNDNMCVFIAKI